VYRGRDQLAHWIAGAAGGCFGLTLRKSSPIETVCCVLIVRGSPDIDAIRARETSASALGIPKSVEWGSVRSVT
jgi:hypothetical protein